jgi:hypothetical protein
MALLFEKDDNIQLAEKHMALAYIRHLRSEGKFVEKASQKENPPKTRKLASSEPKTDEDAPVETNENEEKEVEQKSPLSLLAAEQSLGVQPETRDQLFYQLLDTVILPENLIQTAEVILNHIADKNSSRFLKSRAQIALQSKDY